MSCPLSSYRFLDYHVNAWYVASAGGFACFFYDGAGFMRRVLCGWVYVLSTRFIMELYCTEGSPHSDTQTSRSKGACDKVVWRYRGVLNCLRQARWMSSRSGAHRLDEHECLGNSQLCHTWPPFCPVRHLEWKVRTCSCQCNAPIRIQQVFYSKAAIVLDISHRWDIYM